MNRIILLTAAPHSAILLISVAVSVVVYKRWRRSIVLSGFISFVLYVLLVNVYFQVGGYFGIGYHQYFREAHEVGWIAAIVSTVVCCKILDQVRANRP